MSVWLTIPSARQVDEVNACMDTWRKMGYKIALWRDRCIDDAPQADFLRVGSYPGYSQAVNALAHDVLEMDPACHWIVAAGDDTTPDPNYSAAVIAAECSIEFGWHAAAHANYQGPMSSTFGVMQPTGDPWSDHTGRIIERIAGSPWLGRDWCLRANKGRGPLWPGFYHCFADETLQCVAQQLGVFWQRPDITHMHNNWARKRGDIKDRPDFLVRATSAKHWGESKAEFLRLKADDFRECLPI